MRPAGGARDLDRDVALAAEAHQRLLGALDALVVTGALDVTAPSALPGWTRGHVVTHVTNSGEGHVRMFEAAADGRIGDQYPDGPQGRATDIETGACRPAADQLDDLRRSIWKLEGRWATASWDGRGRAAAGEVAIRDLPFLRLREVAVHHVDLDIGYTFADLPAEYLRLELRRMEMLWKARQPMGMTPLPSPALDAAPPVRLAWLMGRTEIDGLAPAEIF
jgi:maleylpyruvate isomerase